MAFRNRAPGEATDDELAGLLEDMELLEKLGDGEGEGNEGGGPRS